MEETPDRNILIFDHHLVGGPSDLPPRIAYVSPIAFDLDGELGISGAGTVYCMARLLDPLNRDCSVLALIGAVGDRQDQGPDNSFLGQNAGILQESVQWGYLAAEKSLWLFRGHSRDLVSALCGLRIPQLGEEPLVMRFLKGCGVDPIFPRSEGENKVKRRRLTDLSPEERVKVLNALIVQFGVPYSKILRFVYTIIREDEPELQDIRQFATILNSLGRQGREGLGVALAMGERTGILREVRELERQYARELRKLISIWSTPERVTNQYDNFRAVITRESVPEQMIGTLTSMLAIQESFYGKPVLGVAWSDEKSAKVSVRLPEDMSDPEPTLDLSKVLIQAITECCADEGEAGGHEAAAGARIPREKVDSFLRSLNTILGDFQE